LISLLYLTLAASFVLALPNPEEEEERSNQRRNVIERLYTQIEYPNNVAYLKSCPRPPMPHSRPCTRPFPNDIFHPDVVGRITGFIYTLQGADLNIQYWIATSSDSKFGLNFRNHTIRGYVDDGSGVVVIAVDSTYGGCLDPTCQGGSETPSYVGNSGVVFFRFDENNLITHYDLIGLNQDAFYTQIGLNWKDPSFAQVLIQIICGNHEAYCRPSGNSQYLSYGDCSSALNTKLLGVPSISWSDTLLCRVTHSSMTPVDPVTHCPHISLKGGGMCIDRPYDYYYTSNAQFAPYF